MPMASFLRFGNRLEVHILRNSAMAGKSQIADVRSLKDQQLGRIAAYSKAGDRMGW
jgi:hypothetical protein